MQNKNWPLISTVGVAFVLWASSSYIAELLSGDQKFASHSFRSNEETTTVDVAPSDSETGLIAAVQAHKPGTLEHRAARIQLADAYAREGLANRDMSRLAKALEHYTGVLREDPNHQAALLGIASMSFEAGVLDKAEGYYRRYIALNPTDQKAQNDFALVLIQLNQAEEAITLLTTLVHDRPDFFPPRLSLALAYRVAGDMKSATDQAEIARSLAPDEEAKMVVARFVSEQISPVADSKESAPPAPQSPATAVNAFFRSHPIMGPKITAIHWTDKARVNVVLKEFPIEGMPPFARIKFDESIRGLQKTLSESITIAIVDATTEKVLAEFPPGE